MRLLFTVLLCISLTISCSKQSDHEQISYYISYDLQDTRPQLVVSMEFSADSSGTTTLLYQDSAWGQDSFHNVLHDLQLKQNGHITINRDSGWVVIEHDKAEKLLEFEYTIRQDSDSIITTGDVLRPIVQPEYFQVFGHNLFMIPKHMVMDEEHRFDVSLDWSGLPAEFKIQNSFGNQSRQQFIPATNEQKFHTAVYTGGDFRIHNIDINGNRVAFAIREEWEAVSDSTMVTLLEQTITAQRNFWKDHSQPYFSVTMIPTAEQYGSSFQGTGLTNSFAIAASNNERLELEGLVYLLNHELQHNWTGNTIRNENEEEQYWFSEGFTDYYTIQNIARNKINHLDGQYFILELNRMIRNLFTNPEREAPNSEINYENFWNSYDFSKLPYQRGALFAFCLDYRIMMDSKGEKRLDDLMLDFSINSEQHINHDYFISTANKYLRSDLTPLFNRNIVNGQLPELIAIFEELDLYYTESAEIFDLGYETAEDRRTVTSVKVGSNAYKAGIRTGDYFKSYSLEYGRPDIEANTAVIREGKEFTFKFFPSAEADIPQLEVNENNLKKLGF